MWAFLASKWATALAALVALLGIIAGIFYKGKSAGKRAEKEKNRAAYDEAAGKRDDHEKDLSGAADSAIDDELREQRDGS